MSIEAWVTPSLFLLRAFTTFTPNRSRNLLKGKQNHQDQRGNKTLFTEKQSETFIKFQVRTSIFTSSSFPIVQRQKYSKELLIFRRTAGGFPAFLCYPVKTSPQQPVLTVGVHLNFLEP